MSLKENELVCPSCNGSKTTEQTDRFAEPGGPVIDAQRHGAADVWSRHSETVRETTTIRPCIRCGGTGRVVRLPEEVTE